MSRRKWHKQTGARAWVCHFISENLPAYWADLQAPRKRFSRKKIDVDGVLVISAYALFPFLAKVDSAGTRTALPGLSIDRYWREDPDKCCEVLSKAREWIAHLPGAQQWQYAYLLDCYLMYHCGLIPRLRDDERVGGLLGMESDNWKNGGFLHYSWAIPEAFRDAASTEKYFEVREWGKENQSLFPFKVDGLKDNAAINGNQWLQARDNILKDVKYFSEPPEAGNTANKGADSELERFAEEAASKIRRLLDKKEGRAAGGSPEAEMILGAEFSKLKTEIEREAFLLGAKHAEGILKMGGALPSVSAVPSLEDVENLLQEMVVAGEITVDEAEAVYSKIESDTGDEGDPGSSR